MSSIRDHFSYGGERHLSSLFLLSLVSTKNKIIEDQVKWAVIKYAPDFNIYKHSNIREALLETLSKVKRPDLEPFLIREQLWEKALLAAEKWAADGVFILPAQLYAPPDLEGDMCKRVVVAAGNLDVWSNHRTAILCSRQPRTISPNAPFLQTIRYLVPTCMQKGRTIVSSHGTAGYNAVNTIAYGTPLVIVCSGALPHMNGRTGLNKFLSIYEGLIDPTLSIFVSEVLPGTNVPHKHAMKDRDRLVAALATEIYAVDIRLGGNVHSIVCEARSRGVPAIVVPAPNASYSHQTNKILKMTTLSISMLRNGVKSELQSCYITTNEYSSETPLDAPSADNHLITGNSKMPSYLYHYTRSCPGPWPGQTLGEYWRALLQGTPNSTHTAFDTLYRILDERLVRPSNRFIRGKERVVCFSEVPPSRLSTLARWRKGLTRWSVEPYGLGIATVTLWNLGARPVQYGSQEDFADVPLGQRHLFQIQRSRNLPWDVEREWRVRGSVDLSLVPSQSIIIVVAVREESEIIQSKFGYRCVVVSELNDTFHPKKSPWPSKLEASPGQFGLGERALENQQ